MPKLRPTDVCGSLVEPLRRGLLGAFCLRLQREGGETAEVYTFGFSGLEEGEGPAAAASASAAAGGSVVDYEATESIQSFLARTQLISCWLPQPQQQQQQQQPQQQQPQQQWQQQQWQQQQQQQQQGLVGFSVCAHAIEGVADLLPEVSSGNPAAAAAAEGDRCGIQGEGLLSLPCTAIRAANSTVLTLAVSLQQQQQQQQYEQPANSPVWGLQQQQQQQLQQQQPFCAPDLAESDLADLDLDFE
ncbi:hypothetical protein Emed_005307 [Eimeria media]